MDSKQKYQILHTWREEDPLLWCVVRGAKAPGQMVKMLLWTPKEILEGLAEHRDLVEGDDGRWGINDDSDRVTDLTEMQEFAKELFVKLAAWDRKNKTGRDGNELTDKQATFYEQLRALDKDFTTLEAAHAQGLKKAGFTQSQLQALEKKGKVKQLEGRPRKWRIIPN